MQEPPKQLDLSTGATFWDLLLRGGPWLFVLVGAGFLGSWCVAHILAAPGGQVDVWRIIEYTKADYETAKQNAQLKQEVLQLKQKLRLCGGDVVARNLLNNAGFEDTDAGGGPDRWTSDSFRPDALFETDATTKHAGSRSVKITNPALNDSSLKQSVAVEPNAEYLLSGWLKTDGVAQGPEENKVGASLGIYGTFDHTRPLFGKNDWTFVKMQFNSGQRERIEVACRLGYSAGEASGIVWCDDLSLSKIGSE